MANDIVKRLREGDAGREDAIAEIERLRAEAADDDVHAEWDAKLINDLAAERDRLRAALERIMWIKDCGIDGKDALGEYRNWPDQERDAMYEIARDALAGTAETGEASRYDGHCRNCGASTKIDTGSHCPPCYPPRASVPASESHVLAETERALEQVMTERDKAHELLDRFVAALSTSLGEDFGEHSSGNDPWTNALAAIEPRDAVQPSDGQRIADTLTDPAAWIGATPAPATEPASSVDYWQRKGYGVEPCPACATGVVTLSGGIRRCANCGCTPGASVQPGERP